MNDSDSQYRRARFALVAVLALLLAACGGADDDPGVADGGPPTVVVTNSILGDAVSHAVGSSLDVVTIMPPGADPHDFQASAQQANTIRSAQVLVVNGGGFEAGLVDVIEAAESDGTVVVEALSFVDPVEAGHEDHDDEDHGDEDHGDEDHGDEAHDDEARDDHADEDEHGHVHDGSADPHFFTDPERMAQAIEGIAGALAEIEAVDTEALDESVDAYLAELDALDDEIDDVLDVIDDSDRKLVTNHEVFAAFADRYDFEVVGTVIPATSTTDGASARDLADLVAVVESAGVPAVFSDVSASDDLVQTLASEAGSIDVVALYSESLGPAGSDGATYVDMMRTNAERIATALG